MEQAAEMYEHQEVELQMEPIETAPALVPVAQAYRWLPISRSSVYAAVRAGAIQVERLPVEMFVSREELRRIRGEETLPPPSPGIDRPRRAGYNRARRNRTGARG